MKIKNIAELKDSQLMFDQNPPAFGFFFIMIVCLFLSGMLVWSMKTPKIYTIQTQGQITSNNAQPLMAPCAGTIIEAYAQEGTVVLQGEPIFVVQSQDIDMQLQQLHTNKSIYMQKQEKLSKLITCVENNKNEMKNNDDERYYYNIYESYLAQIQQNTIDVSILENYGYTKQQIELEIKKNQEKQAEIYHSTLQSIQEMLLDASNQIESIDAQIKALEESKETYKVKAPAGGTIHLYQTCQEGTFVQAGQTLGILAQDNDQCMIEAYITPADRARIQEGNEVQIVVDGLIQNIYGTIKGTVASIASHATLLEGNNQSQHAFKIIIDANKNYVATQDGEFVELLNGMSTTCRIHYDKVSYFHYLLEELGIKL